MTAEQEKRCIETFNSTFDCIRDITAIGIPQRKSERINDSFDTYLKIYNIFLEKTSLKEEIDNILKKERSFSNYKKYYKLFFIVIQSRFSRRRLYKLPLTIVKTMYFQKVSTIEEWIKYFAALNITRKPTIEKIEEFMNNPLKKESALVLYEILQPELIISAIKDRNKDMIDEYYNRLDDLLQKYHKYVLFMKKGNYFDKRKHWNNKLWFINRRYLGVFCSLYKRLKINNYIKGEVCNYKCSINNEIISNSEFFVCINRFLKKNNICKERYTKDVWTECFALGEYRSCARASYKKPPKRLQAILDVTQKEINEITNQQKTDK